MLLDFVPGYDRFQGCQPRAPTAGTAYVPHRDFVPWRFSDAGVRKSAQRTEEEAQSAFRAAQAKYAVLAGYHVLIRKKDQGGRGVFYAAQVGPLARDEANRLCGRIKRAGGKCFTLEN